MQNNKHEIHIFSTKISIVTFLIVAEKQTKQMHNDKFHTLLTHLKSAKQL